MQQIFSDHGYMANIVPVSLYGWTRQSLSLVDILVVKMDSKQVDEMIVKIISLHDKGHKENRVMEGNSGEFFSEGRNTWMETWLLREAPSEELRESGPGKGNV